MAKTKSQRIRELTKQGKTAAEIVKIMKCSVQYVYTVRSNMKKEQAEKLGIEKVGKKADPLPGGITYTAPAIDRHIKGLVELTQEKPSLWQRFVKWIRS